jgi:hypothetical protein
MSDDVRIPKGTKWLTRIMEEISQFYEPSDAIRALHAVPRYGFPNIIAGYSLEMSVFAPYFAGLVANLFGILAAGVVTLCVGHGVWIWWNKHIVKVQLDEPVKIKSGCYRKRLVKLERALSVYHGTIFWVSVAAVAALVVGLGAVVSVVTKGVSAFTVCVVTF